MKQEEWSKRDPSSKSRNKLFKLFMRLKDVLKCRKTNGVYIMTTLPLSESAPVTRLVVTAMSVWILRTQVVTDSLLGCFLVYLDLPDHP